MWPVGAYAAEKQVDAAVGADLLFVSRALGFRIGCVAVEDVHVLGKNVDVGEEIGPHESVVALTVFAGQIAVLVHVEGHDILERYLAGVDKFDQFAVHA